MSLGDKRLFEITEVEITRVDCTSICQPTSVILLTYTENKQIFLTVQEFLIKSKRFEIA